MTRPFLLAMLGLTLAGCAEVSYDAPPEPSIVGLDEGGKLADVAAPVILGFHEPVRPDTLRVKILRYDDTNKDAEGVLFDEDADESTAITTLFDYDAGVVSKGSAALDDTRQFLVMTPMIKLPLGPPLAVVVEPGLADDQGHRWKVRKILQFSYDFVCTSSAAKPSTFPNAVHFMQANVDEPISTQLQLIADIRVDPATGTFVGQFTNGDRDRRIDCTPLGFTCTSEQACRTLPAAEAGCVEPSARVSSPDEYPDYTYNIGPETGYSFTATGCIVDQADGSYLFANNPADVVVPNPPVKVDGIRFNALFAFDAAQVLRGTGSFEADQVFLGTLAAGAGIGTIQIRTIPADEVEPGTPAPPCSPEAVESCP